MADREEQGRERTTDQVRRVYSLAPVDFASCSHINKTPDYAAAQFDRWLKAHDAEVAAAALRDAADDENFAATCDHLPWVRLGGHCQCGWLRARADEGSPR